MVQQRAASYVTNWYHNTSSVLEMLDHLNWESLEYRRTKTQLTMMFKTVNSFVDVPTEHYLTPTPSQTRAAHYQNFRQISTSTTYHKESFFSSHSQNLEFTAISSAVKGFRHCDNSYLSQCKPCFEKWNIVR